MAAKMATTDMENIKMTIHYLIHLEMYLFVYVLACFCPPKNNRGYVSMENDVHISNMAVNIATTNTKLAITYSLYLIISDTPVVPMYCHWQFYSKNS